MEQSTVERVRAVLGQSVTGVDAAAVATDDDLFDAGLTSHASIVLMLALEEEFDLEFPDRLLRKSTFATLDSIAGAIDSLGGR